MADSLFNVEKSLMQSRWVMPEAELSLVEQIARQHGLLEIVARLLVSRNVSGEDVEKFLYPTLRRDFPDPFTMADMDATAFFLSRAIQDKKSISIFGDFDVDGATSSAILYRFLKHLGINAPVYIPDRLTEGYGPNEQALQSLKNDGADIVVLLDCGTTAFDTVAAGRAMGLDIVILDHHEAEDALPEATHIINPKRKDDISDLKMLAACGVTFLTCVAINKKLREAGFFEGKDEPPLKDWLDIVALGTVCDMVSLTGVNRLFVRHGFLMMSQTKTVGLKALIDVAKITGPLTPYHAGFILGPRINAGSRVHKADLGAQLLCTDDAEEAKNIAWTLHDCNEKRKDIQAQMEREAIDKVDTLGLDQNPVIVVDDESWHPGLSGLVAGRLKEKYGKPACVVTFAENGEGRGSGRSVPGVHIAQAFIDARNAGLLEKGGGHAMAGGFTIVPEKLSEFREFMINHVSKQMKSGMSSVDAVIDGVLSVRGVRPDFVRLIHDHIGPFGQEHPEPVFALENVRIHTADVLGESHIRLMVSDWEGGSRLKAMAFRAVGTPMGDALLKQNKRPVHLAGTLKIDNWSGQDRVEMHIRDAAFAMEQQEKYASI